MAAPTAKEQSRIGAATRSAVSSPRKCSERLTLCPAPGGRARPNAIGAAREGAVGVVDSLSILPRSAARRAGQIPQRHAPVHAQVRGFARGNALAPGPGLSGVPLESGVVGVVDSLSIRCRFLRAPRSVGCPGSVARRAGITRECAHSRGVTAPALDSGLSDVPLESGAVG